MPALARLCSLSRDAATLRSVHALLNWDQETYMPPAGAPARAEQQALIASLEHERRTSPKLGDLIAACEADASIPADSPWAALVREMRRDYDLAVKLPASLVAEIAKTASESTEAWKAAKPRSDFDAFAPWLTRMIDLARQKAACYGHAPLGEPYDALLNEYEPGMTARQVEAIFTPLRARLSNLVARVVASSKPPSDAPLKVKIEPDRQHKFGLFVLESLGFDLKAGRLDTTTHPFCEGLAPGDTRLTTRYRESSFADALYGTLHEMGHGLYEQGLPKSGSLRTPDGETIPLAGTPLATAISLGIHESQSRLWENFVGRGRPFWEWALPHAKKFLGPALEPYAPDHLYKAANIVRPSFIRVEADEATYNLHIMLRFEIERALLRGSLEAKDVPATWNRLFKESFGLDVPDHARGCMQDIHWAFGLIGYFPTYTLGNLYAAQFWEALRAASPNLDEHLRTGNFAPLKSWLNTHIHAPGRRYRAGDLCQRVTGKPLSADPLLRHLEGKLGPIYQL